MTLQYPVAKFPLGAGRERRRWVRRGKLAAIMTALVLFGIYARAAALSVDAAAKTSGQAQIGAQGGEQVIEAGAQAGLGVAVSGSSNGSGDGSAANDSGASGAAGSGADGSAGTTATTKLSGGVAVGAAGLGAAATAIGPAAAAAGPGPTVTITSVPPDQVSAEFKANLAFLSKISRQATELGATLRDDAKLTWPDKEVWLNEVQNAVTATYVKLQAEAVNRYRELHGVAQEQERQIIDATADAKLSVQAALDLVAGSTSAIAEGLDAGFVRDLAVGAAEAGVPAAKTKATLDALGTLYAEGHFADLGADASAAADATQGAKPYAESLVKLIVALQQESASQLRDELRAQAEAGASFSAAVQALG
ncbi:MAG TPA: hypothetical protein VFK80_08725 [Limnochordia bacterium]|nr:hypothetical protein [Limnochordia bacterium]